MMHRASDWIVPLLFAYFAFLHITVEQKYCFETLDSMAEKDLLMARMTLEFSIKANPLFAERPQWLQVATCLSAYGFLVGGAITTLTFLFKVKKGR